jgi:hypothetical protein
MKKRRATKSPKWPTAAVLTATTTLPGLLKTSLDVRPSVFNKCLVTNIVDLCHSKSMPLPMAARLRFNTQRPDSHSSFAVQDLKSGVFVAVALADVSSRVDNIAMLNIKRSHERSGSME